ncbi:MAG: hypothetical protein MI976_28210, partial [Pseudomonadales bacterium]|nr:hypothetical protein [Pseudomonadales bacterium]
EKVDEKLVKLEQEIERFRSNIDTCDEPEQREILEKDLATLQVIRTKLLKAKELTQEVSDLRTSVENPARHKSHDIRRLLAKFGMTLPLGFALLVLGAVLLGLLVWLL